MTSRTRKLLLMFMALLLVLYVSGPIVAGVYEIGNRRGPKIYPVTFHEVLYEVAWESSSGHEGNKPRIPAVFQAEYRPWFYGMYSKNDDPVWVEAESAKLWARLRAEEPTK